MGVGLPGLAFALASGGDVACESAAVVLMDTGVGVPRAMTLLRRCHGCAGGCVQFTVMDADGHCGRGRSMLGAAMIMVEGKGMFQR